MMMGAAQEPVVSGHGYTITEVDGRRPAGLADCVGEHLLTVIEGGLGNRLFGTGAAVAGGVRFHQKDLGPDGKDVRVWMISELDHTSLIARPCSPSEPRP